MFQKHTLQNGLRVITVPLKNTKTVTVLVMVETGSRYETKETNGISHFLEHMFFKGTKKRPNTLALALEIDRIGGEHNAFTSQEITGYHAKAAAKHEDLLLDIISDMYLYSKFDAKEMELERGVIVEEVNMIQDTPMRYVSFLFEKLLYGDQPAGWLTIGTKENIRSWQREDLIKYFHNHYVASNTVIFVAGDISAEHSLEKVERYFGPIAKKSTPSMQKVKEEQARPEILLEVKKTDQTHFCLGVRAYSARHPDYFILKVLSALLGEGMSSRLFIEVRERRGLAYYVKTDFESYTDSGYLVCQAGVPNHKLKEAVATVLAEYGKLKAEKVPGAELAKVKEYLKGSLLLALETSDEIAFWLAGQEAIWQKMFTPEEIFCKIDAVRAADVRRVAQDIFQNKGLNLALIGPQKEEEKLRMILKF